MIDAEFFISCFFFIVCILVLNFWLINLFVAVITNTFSAIRKDTKKSAFGAAPCVPFLSPHRPSALSGFIYLADIGTEPSHFLSYLVSARFRPRTMSTASSTGAPSRASPPSGSGTNARSGSGSSSPSPPSFSKRLAPPTPPRSTYACSPSARSLSPSSSMLTSYGGS